MKSAESDSKRWLEQAKYDLFTSQWNVKGDLYSPACFWAQQAAEKAAKAYLYAKGERYVLGHSVAELLERCRSHGRDFKSLVPIGAFLDRFYIPTRYPNGLPGGIPAHAYRKRDAMEAIKMAQKVLDFITAKVAE